MTEANGNGNGRRINVPRWITEMAVMSGAFGIVTGVMTAFVGPKVIESATKEMKAELTDRLDERQQLIDERFAFMERQVDKVATTEGLANVKDRLQQMESSVGERLKQIDDRLRAIESKQDGGK